MDADAQSRYPKAYAAGRPIRTPSGPRPPATIDWSSPAEKVFDPEAGVYGRWFAGAECNTCHNAVDRHVDGRARRAGGDHLRQPGHRREAHAHLRRAAATRSRRSAAVLQELGVDKGDRVIIYMPMIPEAVVGDAGLRPHRRHPLGRVRRLRRQGARDPHRRRRAEGRFSRPPAASSRAAIVAYKPLLDEAIDARAPQAASAASSCSGRRPTPR